MPFYDSLQRPATDPDRVGATLIRLLIALAGVALTSSATRVLRAGAPVPPPHVARVRIGNARRAASVSGSRVSITIPVEQGVTIIIASPDGRVIGDSMGQGLEHLTGGRPQ
jgi:hypothetical protein